MESTSDEENQEDKAWEVESDEAPGRSRKACKPRKSVDPRTGITQKQADQATLEGLCWLRRPKQHEPKEKQKNPT